MFIIPFPRLRSAGTFLGFMMPHTVIANGLYATVFLENYSLPRGRIFKKCTSNR